MTYYRAKITAISPAGCEISFEGKQLILSGLAETPKHWSINDELRSNALVGLVPKEWAVKLEYVPRELA